MKSKILYMMVSVMALFSVVGCDDDSTAGLTRITYYPELILDGDTYMVVAKGSTFTDPGYTALLNGEDVTSEVEVTSNVNTAQSGVYTVNYSVVNPDGFLSTASRTVVVLDLSDPVEGFYDTDPNSFRFYNGAEVAYGRSFSILIINNGDGSYSVDDLLGGWYCQRAGYGTRYAMQGNISIAADGTIDIIDSYVAGWGDSANGMTDGKWDAATGTITWMVSYTSYPMEFNVIMYKR